MVKIVINLHKQDASLALILAAVWTVIVQLSMAIIGTFIINDFPLPSRLDSSKV